MNEIKIFAVDIESYSITTKYPTHSDFIIGISTHTTSSLNPSSKCHERLFIADELTYEAEEEIIRQFLEFLNNNQGAILTAYNLVGFDQPLLLARSKEHYPLSFQFLDIIPEFSLYDTMIAYKAYSGNMKSCKLSDAITQLTDAGYDCFSLKNKPALTGKEVMCLWAKEKAGISKEFSAYAAEDSYNHMRLAQILLASRVKQGLRFAKKEGAEDIFRNP